MRIGSEAHASGHAPPPPLLARPEGPPRHDDTQELVSVPGFGARRDQDPLKSSTKRPDGKPL